MASRSSLYSWKRRENRPVFLSHGNVQKWIEQVQKTCNEDIFGDDDSLMGRHDVFVDDDALIEGQDLIDSWIKNKSLDHLLTDWETKDEELQFVYSNGNLPKQNDLSHCNHDFHYHDNSDFHKLYEDEKQKPVYNLDEDFDEETAVNEVVYNMLERDVVDFNTINTEERFAVKTKKFNDPVPKMRLRHEQVKKRAKERNEARKKATIKRMDERTVEEEARQQIQREEKLRLEKIKHEEDEIRKEMIRIRLAMQEENKTKQSRLVEVEEMAEKLTKIELEKQRKESEERIQRETEAKEKMKKKLLKLQEKQKVRKQENIKLLHSCFSSWYEMIVDKQIKYCKARTLLEWRVKLRIWNSWRTYVMRSRNDRETRVLNEEMKENHRKEVLADRFYRQMLFHRYLTAWFSWVKKSREEREMKDDHNMRAEKMATLLKMASSGQLWKDIDTKNVDGQHDSGKETTEVSLKTFKLKDVASNMMNPSTVIGGKRNEHVTTWPHQKLEEMKVKKETRKQNALLQSIKTPAVVRKGEKENDVQLSFESKNSKLQSSNMQQNKTQSNKDKSEIIIEKCNDNYTNNAIIDERDHSQRSRSSTYRTTRNYSKKPVTKPLHLAMDERAKARAERKSILDAKKRAAEKEKLVKLKLEQEEKEREILAEKQVALQRKREEIKLTKQREQEKQRRLNEIKELNNKADEYYKKCLVKNFGLFPWRKLIKQRDDMIHSAEILYKKNLLRTIFIAWMTYTRCQCQRRNQLADNMYNSTILHLGWQSWRKYRNHLAEMEKVALDYSQVYIARKYMRIWQNFAIEERLLFWDKENKADEHNERRLLWKAMVYWKKLIPLVRDEEKREKRRNDLRKHVLTMLPDFQVIKHSP